MTDLQNLSDTLASEIRSAEESLDSDTASKMNKDALKVEEKRIAAEVQINERQAERDENIAEMQLGVQEYRNMFDEMLAKLNTLIAPPTPPDSGDIVITTPITPASEDIVPPETTVPPESVTPETPEQIPEEIGEDLGKEADKVEEEINGPTRRRGRRNRKSR